MLLAVVFSVLYVPILSKAALAPFASLTADSRCDISSTRTDAARRSSSCSSSISMASAIMRCVADWVSAGIVSEIARAEDSCDG